MTRFANGYSAIVARLLHHRGSLNGTRRSTAGIRRGVLCCVLLGSLSGLTSNASAQQPSFPVGSTLRATFDHDRLRTTGYRLKVDGKPLIPDLLLAQAPATGPITIAFPTPAVGDHALQACAFGVDGEACTTDLLFNIRTLMPPAVPTNFQITTQVAVNQDGTVTLISTDVRRVP